MPPFPMRSGKLESSLNPFLCQNFLKRRRDSGKPVWQPHEPTIFLPLVYHWSKVAIYAQDLQQVTEQVLIQFPDSGKPSHDNTCYQNISSLSFWKKRKHLHEIEFYKPYRFAFKIRDFGATTKPLKSFSHSLLLLQVKDSKMMNINWLKIKALLKVGFEYVCEKDGFMFFRKRK